MKSMLGPGAAIIIGVPVEIGIPALYKGFFRMARRYSARTGSRYERADTRWRNVWNSFLGNPPEREPPNQEDCISSHMGFDYRALKTLLVRHFERCEISASPFSALGPRINPEVYFLCSRPLPHSV